MTDLIVIGGGPAGLTACLYMLRAGKSVLLIEKEAIGGQIAKSPRLENYPAIESISGMEWADNAFSQVMGLGVKFDFGEVDSIVKREDGVFEVKYGTSTAESRSVIIATGCEHKKLGLPGEEELSGHGVSYCATCDGAFFKDEDVAVIGDGNTAVQYAISLSGICRSVTIMTLFDHFFADQIITKRMLEASNVKWVKEVSTTAFVGEGDLTGVKYKDKGGSENTLPCSGAFVAIGQVPSNEAFAPLVELEKGFIVVDESKQTKTPGLFAAGDCTVKKVRQVATAISDGAIAAVCSAAYIDSLR